MLKYTLLKNNLYKLHANTLNLYPDSFSYSIYR